MRLLLFFDISVQGVYSVQNYHLLLLSAAAWTLFYFVLIAARLRQSAAYVFAHIGSRKVANWMGTNGPPVG